MERCPAHKRNRRIPPNDDSALKSLFLAIREASKNWTQIHHWKPALQVALHPQAVEELWKTMSCKAFCRYEPDTSLRPFQYCVTTLPSVRCTGALTFVDAVNSAYKFTVLYSGFKVFCVALR
jgi:hypothetical protein